MNRGYVYILTNEAMPGLVKIGKTIRTPEQRAVELCQTGVPFPFDIHESFLSPDCHELEAAVHKNMADCRVNDQREFFLCGAAEATHEVKNAHREQIEFWLNDYLPDHGIHEADMAIDESFAFIMATHFELLPVQIIDAYGYLYPEDMKPAINRMRAHMSGDKKMEWLRPVPTGVDNG